MSTPLLTEPRTYACIGGQPKRSMRYLVFRGSRCVGAVAQVTEDRWYALRPDREYDIRVSRREAADWLEGRDG